MTGPEFAAQHGNDSTAWTSVDFEAEINLAEIDRLPNPATVHQLPGGTTSAGKTTDQHAA